MANYPEILDSFTPKTDNTNDVMAVDVNELQTAISALETKVGIDESADTTSLDYKIAQLQSGKQDALGFTPENVSNKKTTITSSDDDYPTCKAVETGLAGKQASGSYEVSTNKKTDLSDNSDNYYPSQKAVKTAVDAKQATLVSGTNIKTINSESLLGSGDIEISSGGTSLWTAITGTRASNTTITVSGDQTAIFKKGMIVRWTESDVIKWGMVSIPSTYSSPNTTITIIGCVCASIDANSFKYSSIIGVEQFQKNFVIAGGIGAVATNVANAYYATEPMYVIGADLQVGTAGTTNSTTIDLNKNGTSMFATKPNLATTVASSPLPFTADTATTLALGDKVTLDVDAVQTTIAQDLYAQLYVVPQRYFTLS